jgi:hypothetical protein
MADNVQITAGSGTTIATDDIGGGVQVQRFKATWGVDGTATDVQRTAAAALPETSVGTGTNATSQVTVTNGSTTIVSAREGRRGVLLYNLQTVAVYIEVDGTAATTSNFRLDPGASMFLPVTTAVTGITSAAYSASPADAQVHVCELY